MKVSRTPYPLLPPQISREPASDTRLIFVVPWRGPGTAESFDTWLRSFVPSAQAFEMIVLIYSFEEDEDQVNDSNLDFYWYLESARENWLQKGVIIYPVHVTGMEQRWKNTNIAAFTGMREAAQRLLDNGRANGIISLLDHKAQYSAHYPKQLLEFYDQNPDCGLSECLWQYAESEKHSQKKNLPVIDYRKAELKAKLINLQLHKAGYHLPVFAFSATLSLRAWVFRQINGKINSANALAEEMMHLAGLEGTEVLKFRKGQIVFYPDQWKDPDGQMPPLPANDSFRQIHKFLLRNNNFYRAQTHREYQDVLASLDIPVRAFLQARQFFQFWQTALLNAHNPAHFRQLLSSWLSPLQIKKLLQVCCQYEQKKTSLIEESALFLANNYSIQSGILNTEQLLEYIRKAERGMQIVESRKWA